MTRTERIRNAATAAMVERGKVHNATLAKLLPPDAPRPGEMLAGATLVGAISTPAAAPAMKRGTPTAAENVWTIFHQRSLRPVSDESAELNYLRQLADGQPMSCTCRADWASYLTAHPPTLTTPTDYFAWGVAAHNAVNRRLGKPVWSATVAAALYDPQDRAVEAVVPLRSSQCAFPLILHSPEWTDNIRTCRNGGTAGVGVCNANACPHHRRGAVEVCVKDGGEISTHAMRGTCPAQKQPYLAGREKSAVPAANASPASKVAPAAWFTSLPDMPALMGERLGDRDWTQYFGAAYVVNLDRAPERLERFDANLPKDWPLPRVERLRAIDTRQIPTPSDWRAGGGAFGLYSTYRAAIERALTDGIDKPLIFFEDDCRFVDAFGPMVRASLANTPDDWDLFFFGAQSKGQALPVAPGVRRLAAPHRTHSWAVHPRFFKSLLRIWQEHWGHVDWALTQCGRKFKVLACDPFLTAQAAGQSYIGAGHKKIQSWDGRTTSLFEASERGAINHHVFCAGAKIGDLLYCLPLLRHVGRAKLLYRRAISDAYIPSRMHSILAPLLNLQPYIEAFESGNDDRGTDLEAWRFNGNSKRHGEQLADHYRKHAGFDAVDYETPWIAVDRSDPVARVLINRTLRYPNSRFPWCRVMDQYAGQLAFVGTAVEHVAFEQAFGNVPRVDTREYLSLARLLAGADLFIGNQSSVYALAEAMKINTVQAVCPTNADCMFTRSNAVYGWDEAASLPELS